MVSGLVLFGFNAVLSLWLVPFLVRNLGVAAYGLIPLTASAIAYLNLLTLSLNAALGRYLTIELTRERHVEANRLFNTALLASLVLGGLVALICSVFVWQLSVLFVIPPHLLTPARWLMALMGLAFVVTVIDSTFAVSTWACNRFDLKNGLTFLTRVVQVGSTVVLIVWCSNSISYVGAANLGAALFSLAGSLFLWRKLTPGLSINLWAFDRTFAKSLFTMSGWMVINQIGSLLFLNIDLIVLNRNVPAHVCGVYGALLQLSVYLRAFSASLVSVLTPLLVSMHAAEASERFNHLSATAVSILGAILAVPVGLICGFSRPLLTLWLGEEFAAYDYLLVALCFHLSINLAVQPLFSSQVALNRVRIPGIVTLASGAANLGLAIVLVRDPRLAALGVALASAIVLTAKNVFFTTLYGAAVQSLPWWRFLTCLIPGVVGTLLVWGVASSLTSRFNLDSWPHLVGACLVIGLVYLAVGGAVAVRFHWRTPLSA